MNIFTQNTKKNGNRKMVEMVVRGFFFGVFGHVKHNGARAKVGPISPNSRHFENEGLKQRLIAFSSL